MVCVSWGLGFQLTKSSPLVVCHSRRQGLQRFGKSLSLVRPSTGTFPAKPHIHEDIGSGLTDTTDKRWQSQLRLAVIHGLAGGCPNTEAARVQECRGPPGVVGRPRPQSAEWSRSLTLNLCVNSDGVPKPHLLVSQGAVSGGCGSNLCSACQDRINAPPPPPHSHLIVQPFSVGPFSVESTL